ncbi:hypothetical protein [Fibrella aestuarina]|nr:hypothetical protein [Fibrella aestuarina]
MPQNKPIAPPSELTVLRYVPEFRQVRCALLRPGTLRRRAQDRGN